MNTQKLEQSSITKLRDCIDRCKHLSYDIHEIDKTPSWDGEISSYNSENFQVSTLVGRVPIQVKAHAVKNKCDLEMKEIKRQVRTNDLKNYLRDGGAMYFVIQIYDFNSYAIYYNSLLPLDISNWINIAQGKKSVTISFTELDSMELEKIIFNFLEDRKLQYSTVSMIPQDPMQKAIMLSQFKKFSFGVVATNDPFDYMFKHPIYIYGDLTYAKVPLHRIQTDEISTTLPLSVKVDGKQYYSEVTIKKTTKDEVFCFGKCFEISKALKKITFSETGDSECRWKALNFMKALLEFKRMDIDDSSFSFDDLNIGNQVDFEHHFNEINELRNTLQFFGVTVPLNCVSISPESEKSLSILKEAYRNNGIITFTSTLTETVCCIDIENVRVLLYFTLLHGLTYKVESLFLSPSKKCELHANNEIVPCSIFCILGETDFETISNVNYECLIQDLLAYEYTEIYVTKLVELLLNMLHAFDTTKNAELLRACECLSKSIMDKFPHEHRYVLNYLQCVKRSRALNDLERRQLYDIRKESAENIVQLGVAVLLENSNDILFYFSTLSNQEKQAFKSFPIAVLAHLD